MLQLSSALLDRSVLSLRTGKPVAGILAPVINPDNLKIEGFYCEDRFSKKTLILLCQDIRDMLPNGFFVDDHEVLVEAHDLVRMKNILEIAFDPIGKQVETVSKQKVGKVGDYATDTSSMYIQKIYVSQNLLKSFTGGNLSVDRNQIHEITPKRIIINDLMKKAKVPSAAAIPNVL